MLARIFRTLNAKIISTRYEWVRKPLKVLLLVAQGFARRSVKKLNGVSTWTVINNFDGDTTLKIDRSRAMGASFYWTGLHEFREFIFLNRFLTRQMVTVDVGANLGEYTLFMAKRTAHVFSFEPLPANYNLLRWNINQNNFANVKVFEFALSDKSKSMEIHEIEDNNEGLGTFYPGEKKTSRKQVITLKSLDEIFPSLEAQRLDFIKMDIEGAELFALQGAKHTLQKYRPLVMVEVSEENYKAAGYTVSDVNTFFNELNYQAHQINKAGKLVLCSSLPSFGNVIFVPR